MVYDMNMQKTDGLGILSVVSCICDLFDLCILCVVSSRCQESQREAALLLGQFATTDPECKVLCYLWWHSLG